MRNVAMGYIYALVRGLLRSPQLAPDFHDLLMTSAYSRDQNRLGLKDFLKTFSAEKLDFMLIVTSPYPMVTLPRHLYMSYFRLPYQTGHSASYCRARSSSEVMLRYYTPAVVIPSLRFSITYMLPVVIRRFHIKPV